MGLTTLTGVIIIKKNPLATTMKSGFLSFKSAVLNATFPVAAFAVDQSIVA